MLFLSEWIENKNQGCVVVIVAQFSLYVSFSQVAVFDDLERGCFNDWSPQHSNQGFTWRYGSVSFGTLEEAEMYQVIVENTREERVLSPAAVRVIDVPFEVSAAGKIEIASITEAFEVDMAPGRYQLRFEMMEKTGDADPVIRLSFRPSDAPIFQIVRQDAGLHPGAELLLTSQPAS